MKDDLKGFDIGSDEKEYSITDIRIDLDKIKFWMTVIVSCFIVIIGLLITLIEKS